MCSKVKAWLSKNWMKLLLWAAAAFGAAIVIRGVWKVVAGIVDHVDKPTSWVADPKDKNRILVDRGDGWAEVALPEGVTSDKVKAAGMSPDLQYAEVEIAHDTTDRTHAGPDAGGALGIR